jgi:hypothetical protein
MGESAAQVEARNFHFTASRAADVALRKSL